MYVLIKERLYPSPVQLESVFGHGKGMASVQRHTNYGRKGPTRNGTVSTPNSSPSSMVGGWGSCYGLRWPPRYGFYRTHLVAVLLTMMIPRSILSCPSALTYKFVRVCMFVCVCKHIISRCQNMIIRTHPLAMVSVPKPWHH